MIKKNIVVIGGGTGVYTVLSGLKKYPVNLSAIVTMADNGGSSRILREDFGILPPGDVRRALVALSQSERVLASLFNYRFKKGGLAGHSFGNLFITALERIKGDFEKAIEEAGKILNIKGEVIPVTLQDTNLHAVLENGQVIKGEDNIDVPKHDARLKIKKVYLKPNVKINPKARLAILKADLIVIGPGDLYTSIIPNLLVRSISRSIRKSRAKKVYICNLMTKLGETNNFTGSDFIDEVEKYLSWSDHPSRKRRDVVRGKFLNYVIFNNKRPSPVRVVRYEREGATFVKCSKDNLKNRKIQVMKGNFLRKNGLVRHDPNKLAKTLLKILDS